jgi:hypothetical protein
MIFLPALVLAGAFVAGFDFIHHCHWKWLIGSLVLLQPETQYAKH